VSQPHLRCDVGLGEGEYKQEAQLSQRDCATLRVIEYFATSLEVIRKDTVE